MITQIGKVTIPGLGKIAKRLLTITHNWPPEACEDITDVCVVLKEENTRRGSTFYIYPEAVGIDMCQEFNIFPMGGDTPDMLKQVFNHPADPDPIKYELHWWMEIIEPFQRPDYSKLGH